MKSCILKLSIAPMLLLAQVCSSTASKASRPSELEISVSDVRGTTLPGRIHIMDQQGNAQVVEGQPFWHDHFVIPGWVTAPLAPGKYDVAIERGPEYKRHTSQFEIAAGTRHTLAVRLERIADLRKAGWYCADLHVHRPIAEIQQLMLAEDLDFAPVITWWNNRNLWKAMTVPEQVVQQFDGHRLYSVMAGEDEREGGALLYFGLKSPLDIVTNDREFPSPLDFVQQARKLQPMVWIDIEKPFWWDVPVWLASGQVNSIGVANNHMCRSTMYSNEAWGKPRDTTRLPEPLGNGYWTQEIYYNMLNTGLRLPPSAGSASGVLPNPVGYNRVYVHLDDSFTYDAWFHGLSRGRCFVTNGPLLIVTVNGDKPGGIISVEPGTSRTVRVEIELTSQDPIHQLEIIKNGKVAHTVDCTDELTQRHAVDFSVDGPSWFLVRAIADVNHTFRFATTAPWFVEVPDAQHHISRASVQFFLDWLDERTKRVKANIKDESQLEPVLIWHDAARRFWAERLKMANSE